MLSFQTTFINKYDQNSYKEDIKKINYFHIRCTCGSVGHFHNHATYTRYLQVDVNDTIQLTITRIKCQSCNCTHALLPSIIVPYRILSNPNIIRIITSFRNTNDSISVISKLTGFSRELVRKLIIFYLKYHKERLDSFLSVFSSCDLLSFDFIISYFAEYHTMFMQRILTKNMIIYS